jgi:O-antigen ligase
MGMLPRMLLGVAILEIPLQFDASLFYMDRWADLGAIGGLNISITTFCLIALYVLWFLDLWVKAGAAIRQQIHVSAPLTAYLAIVTLSVLIATDPTLAVFGVFLLLQAYLLYTYVANHVRSRGDVLFVTACMVMSLALQGAIMIAVRGVGETVNVSSVRAMINPDLRVGGTIGSPNSAASFLSLVLAPALAVLVMPVGRGWKLLSMLAIALGSAALYLTASRGGWLATGISIGLFFWFAWKKGWVSLRLPLACLVPVLIFVALSYGTIAARIVSNDQGAVTSRFMLLEIAGRMLADQPLLGYGVNNYAAAAELYVSGSDYRGEWVYTVHNKFVLELVELGPLGLIAFLWFLVATLQTGWRAWQKQDRVLAPLALALTAAVVGQMLQMNVELFNARPQVQYLWLCAGLIVAMTRLEPDR